MTTVDRLLPMTSDGEAPCLTVQYLHVLLTSPAAAHRPRVRREGIEGW